MSCIYLNSTWIPHHFQNISLLSQNATNWRDNNTYYENSYTNKRVSCTGGGVWNKKAMILILQSTA